MKTSNLFVTSKNETTKSPTYKLKSVAIGIIPVIRGLESELFPTEIRTHVIGISHASFLASGVLDVKFFPQMKQILSLHGLFFLYAALDVAGCLWGLKTIADNRGKSLIKVEEMYEKKNMLERNWMKKLNCEKLNFSYYSLFIILVKR